MFDKNMTSSVVQPKNQKEKRCRYCGHRLSFGERHKLNADGVVICPKCGEVYRDKKVVY